MYLLYILSVERWFHHHAIWKKIVVSPFFACMEYTPISRNRCLLSLKTKSSSMVKQTAQRIFFKLGWINLCATLDVVLNIWCCKISKFLSVTSVVGSLQSLIVPCWFFIRTSMCDRETFSIIIDLLSKWLLSNFQLIKHNNLIYLIKFKYLTYFIRFFIF